MPPGNLKVVVTANAWKLSHIQIMNFQTYLKNVHSNSPFRHVKLNFGNSRQQFFIFFWNYSKMFHKVPWNRKTEFWQYQVKLRQGKLRNLNFWNLPKNDFESPLEAYHGFGTANSKMETPKTLKLEEEKKALRIFSEQNSSVKMKAKNRFEKNCKKLWVTFRNFF